MNVTNQKINMLEGSLKKNILLFTLPIALSSMLQQLFNAADTSIVGYFDSANALAAVGTNGEIVALIVTLSSGLAIGSNVWIATKIGQKQMQTISPIVHTSILLAVIVGIIGTITGQFIAHPLLSLIQTPVHILPSAELYLRIYFFGYPFLLLYDFGSAILRARGDSRYPFIALTIAGIVNVFLNLFLVIFFHLGVTGVALATDISTFLSAVMVLFRLQKDTGDFHLSCKKLKLHSTHVTSILKIGIPSALQGAVFCFANIFVQAAVNHFGSIAIAGSTIAMNFEYFTYYVITAFGQTATTFTSQNYAAGYFRRCRQILFWCTAFSILFSSCLILPIVIFRNWFSGLFSTEPLVIENACLRILCILLYEPICNLYEIPAGVLRGTGHSLLPAIMTILGTCAFRILWICIIFHQHPALNILYMAFPLSWLLTLSLILISFILIRPFKN